MLNQNHRTEFIFKSFKRHQSKVQKSFKLLGIGEGISFTFSYSFKRGEGISTQLETPNDEKTMIFVVLMRRFLNPTDTICCKNVWSLIKEHFGDDLPNENIRDIDEIFISINKGLGQIIINGNNLSNEKIYHIIADGTFFSQNDKEAVKFLTELSSNPVYLHLWFEFYTYNIKIYELSRIILGILLSLEKSARYQGLFPHKDFSEKRCIFCMTEDGPFTTEEHIIPEALGNYDTVLSEGYVCNTCNNTTLSILDHNLVDSDLLGLLRVYFVPYTKTGTFPKAKYQNVVLQKTGPNKIELRDTTNRKSLIVGKPGEDGLQEFTINFRAKNFFDARSIGRAVYKIGLEMIALQMGKDNACNSSYDVARAFILNDKDFPNNLIVSTKFKPKPTMTIHCDYRLGGTCIILDIYGIVFIFNLETYPVLEYDKNMEDIQRLIGMEFTSFPLYNSGR